MTLRQLGGQALRLLGDRWRALLPTGLACRRALWRVAVLGLIAVLSVAVAWLAWTALLDYRLRLGGAATTTSLSFSLEAGSTTRELEADLVARPGRSVEAAPGRSATAARTGPAPSASGGGGLEIDGHVLGGLAAGAALGTGALLGRVVLRRFRDRPAHAPHVLAPALAERDAEHEPVAADAAPAREDDELGGVDEDEPDDLSSTVSASPSTHLALDTSARADADADARQHEPGLPVLDDPRQAASSSATAVAQQIPPQPVYAARERVYERRRSPRVAVRLDGQLHWRGQDWPVTVFDLSDSGLRLTLARRPSIPGRQAPLTAGDHVRVSFEAASAAVEVRGQVAWQRPGPSGCDVGMFFAVLPADDLDLVLAVCAAHTPVPADVGGGLPGA